MGKKVHKVGGLEKIELKAILFFKRKTEGNILEGHLCGQLACKS